MAFRHWNQVQVNKRRKENATTSSQNDILEDRVFTIIHSVLFQGYNELFSKGSFFKPVLKLNKLLRSYKQPKEFPVFQDILNGYH